MMNIMTHESFLYILQQLFNKKVAENPLEFSEYHIRQYDDRVIIEKDSTNSNDKIVSISASTQSIRFYVRYNGFPLLRGAGSVFSWNSYKWYITLQKPYTIQTLIKFGIFTNTIEHDKYLEEMHEMLHNTLDFEFENETGLVIPLYKYKQYV